MTVEQDILERFVGFYRGLLSSPNREVTIMARIAAADIRSNTAKNLRVVETRAFSTIGAIGAIGLGPPQNGGLQISHIWSFCC